MSKILKTGLVVLVASLFVTSCRHGGRDNDSKHQLSVGSILSLTGPAAAYGTDADKGARMAFEAFNRSGQNFQIRYLPGDDKSDKTEAVRVARDMVEADRVNIILGPAISPSAISVGALADTWKIPIIATSATQDDVTTSSDYQRQYVFRVCFNDQYQGRALATFAHQDLKLARAVIIYDKTLSYSIGLSQNFERVFAGLGGQVVDKENYSVNDTDFAALIDKVARMQADLLFIPGWDENVGPMLKQAGSKWDKFVILGGDGIPTPKFLELSGGVKGRVYALSHYAPGDPTSAAFQAQYRTRFGDDPSPFAALGYDAAQLIIDAAKRSKTWKGEDLKVAIEQTKDLRLVTGTLSFDAQHNPIKDAVIVSISGHKMVFQQRIRPQF